MAVFLVGLTLLWVGQVQAEEEDWAQVTSLGSVSQTATHVEGDVVYVAYRSKSDSLLRVRKYENGGWVQLGPEPITTYQVSSLSIYVDQGVPYVAFQEFVPLQSKSGVTVIKYDADQNEWVPVGDRLFHTAKIYGYINKTRLAVDNGNVYAAISEFVSGTDYVSYVMKYSPDTGEWEELGGDEPLDSSLLISRDLEMQVVDGVVYVARNWDIPGTPYSTEYLLVHKFDDTVPDGRWEEVTAVTPEWVLPNDFGNFGTSIYQNKPYMAYFNFYGQTHVYAGEQNWQLLGTLGDKVDYGYSILTEPVIRWYNGLMYVAYAYANSDRTRVYLAVSRYDGSNWTMLGNPIPSSEKPADTLYRIYDFLSLHIEQGVLTLGVIDAGTGQYQVFTFTDSIELDTPPAVAADPEEKGMNDAFELTFEDDEDWRERIDRIAVDGKTIYRDVDYIIEEGKITILPGRMPAAGFVTINIVAEGYLGVPVVQKVVPSTPPSVSVPSAGDSYVKVAWTAVPGVDAYRIYYSTSPDPYHASDARFVTAPYNLAVKERVISSLLNGTTYYFAVTALADGLESPPADVVQATPSGRTDEGSRPWQLLDGSFPGLSPSLHLDGDTVYAAYREDGETTVLKWEEDAWVPVGERKFSVGNGYEPEIVVDGQVPYVAYSAQDGSALVVKFDGENWVMVGDALSTEDPHHFSMAVHEGIPYVAYVEGRDEGNSWYHGALKVKMLDSDGEWTAMAGLPPLSNVRSDTVMLRFDGDRHLFVSFRDASQATVRLYQWDLQAEEPAWQEVVLPDAVAGAGFASMAAVPDSIYVLISVIGDQPGGTLVLWQYDRTGGTWSNLGGGFPGGSGALTVDLEQGRGVPHVAYTVRNGAEMEAIVQKYVNGEWYALGGKVYPQGTSLYDLDLAVSNYTPYVIYYNNGNAVEVRTLIFDDWCAVTLDPDVEGSAVKIVSLPCGEPLPEPAPHAQKANYYFDYWSEDGETPFDFTQRIETSLTLRAVWNLFAPEDVRVTAYGDGTLTLEWETVAGASGYRIYRGESADAIDTFVDEVTGTTFTDTGLTNGRVYYYAVTATDGIVESKRSAAADGKPRTVPEPPRDVEAEWIDGPIAVLSFARPEDGGSEITGYRVMVVPDEDSELAPYPYGSVFDAATAGDEEVELEIEGLQYNIGYRFQVAAENSEGISDWSALSERVVPRLSCDYLLYDKDGTDAVGLTQPCLDPVDNAKVRAGFQFAGWHLDDDVTQGFVPSDDHAGETVPLYAKWIRTGDPLPENEWTVLDHLVDQKVHLHSIVHQGDLYSVLWDDGYLTVRKFDGRQWMTAGSPRFARVGDMVFNPKAILFAEDETLYVAYTVLDTDTYETTIKFSRIELGGDNLDWEGVWEGVTDPYFPSLAGFVVHQGVPYMAYTSWMGNYLMKRTDAGWEAVAFPDSDQMFEAMSLMLDGDRLYLYYRFLDMTTFNSQRQLIRLDLDDVQSGWTEAADFDGIEEWYPGSAYADWYFTVADGTPTMVLQFVTQDGSIHLVLARELDGEWVKSAERMIEAKPNVQQGLSGVSFVMDGQTPYLAYTRNEFDWNTSAQKFEHQAERLHGTGAVVIGNGPVTPVISNTNGIQLLKSERDLYFVLTSHTANQTLYLTLNLPVCEVVFYDSDLTELGRQTVICGETATAPSPDPEREHHDFAGWHADKEGTTAYDFSQPVETDLALYAKWEPQVPSAPEQVAVKEVGDGYVKLEWTPSPRATRYNLYMSASEQDAGDRVATVTDSVYAATGLDNGTTYYFYVTAENDTGGESDHSARVSATPERDACTISFNPNGGSSVASITVPCGDAADEPDTVPVLDGYAFEGWYADPALTEPYAFGVPVTSNLTLHAKWSPLPPVGEDDPGEGGEDGRDDEDSPGEDDRDDESGPGEGDGDGRDDEDDPGEDDGGEGDGGQGGGESGGGSNSPNEPATGPEGTPVHVFVNGQAEIAGTAMTTEAGGRRTTVIVLDENRIGQRLNDEGEQAVISIRLDTDSETVIGELTGLIVKRMEEMRAVVEIQTGRGAYKIPAENLFIEEVAGRLGSESLQDIKIRIELAIPEEETIRFVEDAAETDGLALVVPPLDFTVRAILDDRTEEISTFRAYVERLVAIPDDVDASRITTGVYIGPDGSFHHVPTRIVVIDGKTYAQLNSITNSMYSVIWNQATFSDIGNHWARETIVNLGSRLVLSGYEDGRFRPDRPVTRAEFAAFLVRGLGLLGQEGAGAATFTDVSEKDWYRDAAGTAAAYGLIRGLADGRFAGSDRITREQAMAIMARAMALTGLQGALDDDASEDEMLRSFADAGEVSGWARREVAVIVRAGIVLGKDRGALAPGDMLSRAEAAVLIHRLLTRSGLIED
jgi:uncharacterized repeat protein (TIGR02543 family)